MSLYSAQYMVCVNDNVKLSSLNTQTYVPLISYQALWHYVALQVFTKVSEEHMESIFTATLGMLVAYSFEKLVPIHHTTSRHN
jgi:tRNA C32,U32 (ribose-2'-O)-methylase TrmJ